MKHNGAVVCFQKYTIANMNQDAWESSPVCLGYFNRVDVKTVTNFRDYVKHASKHEAGQACSRKQLLLRKLRNDKPQEQDKLHAQIEIKEHATKKDRSLPFFRSGDPEKAEQTEYGLCCCTALNIVRTAQPRNLTEAADMLYERIHKLQDYGNDFAFAITGLMGTEDLCLLILANRYDAIVKVLGIVDEFECNGWNIDNSHSIIMIDMTENSRVDPDGWKDVCAEIRFSLRSAHGMKYLRYIIGNLVKRSTSPSDAIKLQSCTGEYDAVIKCPAYLLNRDLFGPNGEISGINSRYKSSVYQSETTLCSLDMQWQKEDGPAEASSFCCEVKQQKLDATPEIDPEHTISATAWDLSTAVEEALAELRKLFNSDKDDNDFDYFELPLWRLLKEYWSFAAFPYSEELRLDVSMQFQAAINAIVEEALKAKGHANGSTVFLEKFNQIVSALSASMQATSQIDRLNFSEQQSYTYNVGAYYKVLRCYYGIVKDILKLVYDIERKEGNEQPCLIPLLSFEVTTLIKSISYDSFLKDDNGKKRQVRLICIKLPYQALANPPKYLGILAHEIFHYAAPSDRRLRNELLIDALIKVAFTEFISILARATGYTKLIDYAPQFYAQNRDLVDNFLAAWKKQQNYSLGNLDHLTLTQLKYSILPNLLQFNKERNLDKDIYFGIWRRLRAQMKNNIQECDIYEKSIFALEEEDLNAESTVGRIEVKIGSQYVILKEKDKTEQELFREILSKIGDNYVTIFNNLLSHTINALEEIPPDMFDLGTVLSGKSAEKKISQFLWQIHGTKREFMTGIDFPGDSDERMRAEDRITNSAQDKIRVNYIVEYFLRVKGSDRTASAFVESLSNWNPDSEKYRDRFGNVKNRFIDEYVAYKTRFENLTEPALDLCEMVNQEILTLYNQEEQRLSSTS